MDRERSRAPRNGANLTADLFPVTTVEEPRSISLRGRDVSFVLKRSQRRRRIAFLVDDAGLSVHAPWRASDRAVEDAIHGASRWILGKLEEWSHRAPARVRTWRDGDTVEYLGRPVHLTLSTEGSACLAELMDAHTLRVRLPHPDDPEAVRATVVKWYRRHAERHFPDRVLHYAAALGVERPKILLSDAVGRWGSCNSKGEVRLNWRLMQAPADLVDYVIAHEIAHLLHMNHSARFWRAVGRIFPDYEAARTELSAQSRHFMSL